jgi:hypothetical protein
MSVVKSKAKAIKKTKEILVDNSSMSEDKKDVSTSDLNKGKSKKMGMPKKLTQT